MPTFVDRATALKHFQESQGATVDPFYKYFDPSMGCTIKVPEAQNGNIVFTISTGAVDRDNDTIDPTGWNLKNYKKNPVIMWGHDYSMPPIGRSPKIGVKDGELVASAKFVSKEIYPFAGMIEEMIREDFLKSTSVGFRGEETMWNEKRGGFDFKKQELMEFSVVGIPSNPEAIVQAKHAGIDINPMVEWAEKVCFLQKGLMEDEETYDATWLKFVSDNIKKLNKKMIFVDLDLMESKGTFFKESSSGGIIPSAQDDQPTDDPQKDHEDEPPNEESPDSEESPSHETVPPVEAEVSSEEDPEPVPTVVAAEDEGVVLELIQEDGCCVELELDDHGSMERIMAGVTAGLQDSITKSLSHVPVDALVKQAMRRTLGRLD